MTANIEWEHAEDEDKLVSKYWFRFSSDCTDMGKLGMSHFIAFTSHSVNTDHELRSTAEVDQATNMTFLVILIPNTESTFPPVLVLQTDPLVDRFEELSPMTPITIHYTHTLKFCILDSLQISNIAWTCPRT
jgi:hypothetical protein